MLKVLIALGCLHALLMCLLIYDTQAIFIILEWEEHIIHFTIPLILWSLNLPLIYFKWCENRTYQIILLLLLELSLHLLDLSFVDINLFELHSFFLLHLLNLVRELSVHPIELIILFLKKCYLVFLEFYLLMQILYLLLTLLPFITCGLNVAARFLLKPMRSHPLICLRVLNSYFQFLKVEVLFDWKIIMVKVVFLWIIFGVVEWCPLK